MDLFGVGRSTVCTIVQFVSKAIVNILMPELMRFSFVDELRNIIAEFEEISGFPQAVGAIDGCHIRIKPPIKDPYDYVNRKDYHSIILQGFVDSKYMFRDIFVGWPGKSHDARVFKNSPLYQECLKRTLLPMNLSRNLFGTDIPPLVLGDSAYPLEEFIMKLYADRGRLNEREKLFNNALSRSRVVVENVFGRFKGRFQCPSKHVAYYITYASYEIKIFLKTGCKDWTSIWSTTFANNLP